VQILQYLVFLKPPAAEGLPSEDLTFWVRLEDLTKSVLKDGNHMSENFMDFRPNLLLILIICNLFLVLHGFFSSCLLESVSV